MLEAFARRVKSFTVGESTRQRANMVRGLATLPITVEAA